MSNSLTHDPIRELPICRQGFTDGRDVGLRIALDAITAEWARVTDAGITANLEEPNQLHPHAYAAGRLHAVAGIVGATFRNATPSTITYWPGEKQR